ncbi:hypothetical protein KC19_11G148900 [Ceratodon purpureus]|uniref:N-acetyltransferase domain-containing protein n=2 Tax=Ceratodon purpureus TaxID=3225 RepID=A0A8T0GE41_CERPU|nr:hypothetical protein KC19_11G148900 [Ceratodon purpureus]
MFWKRIILIPVFDWHSRASASERMPELGHGVVMAMAGEAPAMASSPFCTSEERRDGAMAADQEAQRAWRVRTLPPLLSRASSSSPTAALVDEFARLERRIFPKHESLSSSFAQEVKKRNQTVLYVLKDDVVKGEGDVEETADPAKVAGYLMYSWTSLAASITKLAVRDTCRRQGYGEALIHAAVQHIRDRRLQCVNLHVDPTRSAAVALYKKNGFLIETTVKSYYAADRDAYRMALQLTSPDAL